jgi:hypothetical protein
MAAILEGEQGGGVITTGLPLMPSTGRDKKIHRKTLKEC